MNQAAHPTAEKVPGIDAMPPMRQVEHVHPQVVGWVVRDVEVENVQCDCQNGTSDVKGAVVEWVDHPL